MVAVRVIGHLQGGVIRKKEEEKEVMESEKIRGRRPDRFKHFFAVREEVIGVLDIE